jgi:hypothetical protein
VDQSILFAAASWITSLRSVFNPGLPHCVRFSKDVLFEVQGKVKRLQRFSFFMA